MIPREFPASRGREPPDKSAPRMILPGRVRGEYTNPGAHAPGSPAICDARYGQT